MTKSVKPGQSVGKDGGIYQERGPRGGLKENYSTIADNHRAPPTQDKNHSWVQIERTPDSKHGR